MAIFRSILVPTDFSEHAKAALDLALELAPKFEAKVHLLHAYEIPISAIPPYGVEMPPALVLEVRDAAARQLEKAAANVRARGMQCEAHLLHAPPIDAIVEGAGLVGADLIVMGTRGLTGFKHALLGSVTERTIRSVACPVLTVKARPT